MNKIKRNIIIMALLAIGIIPKIAISDINIINTVPVIDPNANKEEEIFFSADEMETNSEENTITARGSVNIVRGKTVVTADEVIYYKDEDKVVALGNVVLLDGDGSTVYSDRVDLRDKMNKVDMESVKVVLKDESKLNATRFKKFKSNNKLMEDAVYTPCDACEGKNPLWQIRARKIRHNAQTQDVNYNDAYLELKGVPVVYTPFLSHPDPSVKRRSGLLAPSFTSNNYLGGNFVAKYFWNISDNQSLLLRPAYSTKVGPMLFADYEQYFYNGYMNLSGSYLKDTEDDRFDNKDRGNLYIKGRYEINENWVSNIDWKYVSDRMYLRDVSLPYKDEAWLTSTARVEGFDNRDYAAIETFYYQRMSKALVYEEKPLVVPLVSYETIGDANEYGLYNKNEYSVASIYREDEDSSYRATMINSWALPSTTFYGAKQKIAASVKSDLYYIDNYNYENKNFDGTVFRIYPQLTYEWRLPFVKATETTRQILEPIVVGVLSPNGNDRRNKIADNDSRNPRLDDTNILETDRMAGYDVNDVGSRVSYGLNWSSYGDVTGRTSLLVAQTYSFNDNGEVFNTGYGNGGHLSDYVGRFYAKPNRYLDLNYRFIVDRKDYELDYSELSSRIGTDVISLSVGYIFLKDDNMDQVSTSKHEEREELYLSLRLALARYWSLSIYNRQDLANKGGSLEHGGVVTYEDECFAMSVRMKKDSSNDPQYKGSYEFTVDFILKTIGGFGSG